MIVFLMKIKNQILINKNSFQLLETRKKSSSNLPGIYSYTNHLKIKLRLMNFSMYMIYMKKIKQHNSKKAFL